MLSHLPPASEAQVGVDIGIVPIRHPRAAALRMKGVEELNQQGQASFVGSTSRLRRAAAPDHAGAPKPHVEYDAGGRRLPRPKTANTQNGVICPTSQPKFIPKNPVMNDSGRKIVAITVSCFMASF